MHHLEGVKRISQKLQDENVGWKQSSSNMPLKNLRRGPISNVQVYEKKSPGMVNGVYFDHNQVQMCIKNDKKNDIATRSHFRKVNRNYCDE